SHPRFDFLCSITIAAGCATWKPAMAFMKCCLIPRVCTPEPLKGTARVCQHLGGIISLYLLQLRPRLPSVPALLKMRLRLLQGRHAIRARHRTVDGHRPEPAQTVRSAARLVDAAHLPLAG